MCPSENTRNGSEGDNMGLSIVVMMTLTNILSMIWDGLEAIQEKIFKHTHNKRKFKNGTWIIKEDKING